MRWLLIVVQLLAVVPAALASDWKDNEIKLMPPYCAARLHRTSQEQFQHWQNVLGPDFLHTHHFCNGIGYINRSYSARSAQDKSFALQSAVNEISYVVKRASPTYSLMPEVYLNRGLALSLMKKDAQAIVDMRKALELNPAFVRGYSMLADQYVALKQKDEALQVVTEGLRHVPENKRLQDLYVKLGGKPPFPEPVNPKSTAPVEPVDAGARPDAAVERARDTAAQSNATPGGEKVAEPSASQPAAKPQIGTPTNPWCRFCPDQ
jgi:tetratricopeptide (TPR) repeat protein